ncbi:hypothetical protein [Micromonospora sp. NPDC004704]
MNPHLTGALRKAFDELAETAPPPAGLARTALASARRQRIARRIGGGGVAAAMCAALVGLVATIAPTGTTDGTDQVADNGLKPLVVTAYSGIRDLKIKDGSPHFLYSLLLNPATGRYERVPYRYAMPSPDGERVLVGTGDNGPSYPTRVGVLDRSSGDVRWIDASGIPSFPGYAHDGRWSPDGRQILFTHQPRQGSPSGFVLVDPETLGTTFVPLPDLAAQQDQTLGLAWTPDSKGLALTLTKPGGDREVTGVRFYDLTGRALRTVPAGAPVTGGSFSPAGGQMALVPTSSTGPTTSVTVADPTTGTVLDQFSLSTRAANLVGWADEAHLLIIAYLDGDESPQLLVVDLTGRISHSVPIPFAPVSEIFVGPSAGLPPTATPITF